MATIKPSEYVVPWTGQKAHFLSATKREKFLAAYAKTMNASQACRQCGIKDVSVISKEKRSNPEFRARMEEIKAGRLDELEHLQWEAAKVDPADRRWTLARQRPEEWSEKKLVGHGGKIEHIHHIAQMSDRQLEELVQQYLPVEGEVVEEDPGTP